TLVCEAECVVSRGAANELALLPTGVGEVRHVPVKDLRIQAAVFLDEHRLAVTGADQDRGTRVFVFDLANSDYRPISPEGMDALDIYAMPGANAVIGYTA